MSNDYIHLDDMGKLTSALKQRHYLVNRAEEFAMRTVRLEQVPEPFVTLEKERPVYSSTELLELAEMLGMDELLLNVQLHDFYNFIKENEEALKLFKRLLIMQKMAGSTRMQILEYRFKERRNSVEQRIETVTKNNEDRIKKALTTNTAYKNQLKENAEHLTARKNKLVKSMNKALERAGSPYELSQADLAAFNVLNHHKLIGMSGTRYCVNALELDLKDPLDLAAIVIEVIKAVQPFKRMEKASSDEV